MRVRASTVELIPIPGGPGAAAVSRRHEGADVGHDLRQQRAAGEGERRTRAVEALRRYVRLGEGMDAALRGAAGTLRGRRALEAYVGARREEERQMLHEIVGIDTYA